MAAPESQAPEEQASQVSPPVATDPRSSPGAQGPLAARTGPPPASIGPSPAPPGPSPAPAGKIRDAYLANTRVRVGGIAARISALLLLAGFVGSLATWGKENSIFEVASTAIKTYRPGPAYVVAPLLILLVLPGVRKSRPGFAYRRLYRGRVVVAALLFVAGLVVLVVNLGQLDPGYQIEAGAYVATALLVLGLVGTLAMWPAGLKTVRLDKAGRVEGEASEVPAPLQAQPPPQGRPPPRAQPPRAQPPPPQPPPPQPPPPQLAPPGWYLNPQGPGQRYWDGTRWTDQLSAPVTPTRRSHGGWIALGVLAAVGALVAVLFFAVIQPDIEKKNDAKSALGDARSLVDRSYTISRAARRDAMRVLQSPAAARRADRRLDRVISLRRRAIRVLAPVGPLPLGDHRYDNAAARWTSELRVSIRQARDLQRAMGTASTAVKRLLEMGFRFDVGKRSPIVVMARDSLAAADAQLKVTEQGRIQPLL